MTTRRKLGAGAAIALFALLLAGTACAQSKAAKESVQSTTPSVKPDEAPKKPEVPGDEIDRVVAIVNNDLVLDSDVNEERRFEQMVPFNGVQALSRERLIERIINRDLLLQQARMQPETDISDEDLDKGLAELRKNIPACKQFHCETKAGWTKFLAQYGFTEAAMRERWKMRMQALSFIEERFKQGIRISDADIKNYYDKTFVPAFAKQGSTAPKLDAVKDRIQEVLLEQQVSSLLSDWLKSLRAQGQVVVLHPGEAAP